MTALVFSHWPVDLAFPVTWAFGEWSDSTRTGLRYQHRGIDIGCPTGSPVVAPAGGVVVAPTNDGSFGVAVCLEHPGTGLYSLYAHLASALVVVGQRVEAGAVIGVSDNTGMSSGPHLHWQVCSTPTFPMDISYSRDPASFYTEEDDMTEEQVRALLLELGVAGAGITSPKRLDEFVTTALTAAQGARTLRAMRKALHPDGPQP